MTVRVVAAANLPAPIQRPAGRMSCHQRAFRRVVPMAASAMHARPNADVAKAGTRWPGKPSHDYKRQHDQSEGRSEPAVAFDLSPPPLRW